MNSGRDPSTSTPAIHAPIVRAATVPERIAATVTTVGRSPSASGSSDSLTSRLRSSARAYPRSIRSRGESPRCLRLRSSARRRSRLGTGSRLSDRSKRSPQLGRRRARVGGVADGTDNAEALGSGLHHLRCVGSVDAPDRVEGEGGARRGMLDQPEADGGAALLGRRLPDRADADVVGALGAGGFARLRYLLLGVGREADDRIGTEGGPRLGDRRVVLAQVDAIGSAGRGQGGVVVDGEEGAVGVGEAAEGRAGALDRAAVERLLAQLDDVDAAVESGEEKRLGILAPGARVADEVEAGGAQPLAPQRPGGVGEGEAHADAASTAARRLGKGLTA